VETAMHRKDIDSSAAMQIGSRQ